MEVARGKKGMLEELGKEASPICINLQEKDGDDDEQFRVCLSRVSHSRISHPQ